MTQYKIERGVMKSTKLANIYVARFLVMLDNRVKIQIAKNGGILAMGTKESTIIELYSADIIDSIVMDDFMNITINIR